MMHQFNWRTAHSGPQVFLFWMELSSQIMVLYSWIILVNLVSHFSAWLIYLLVINLLIVIVVGTGSFPMEPGFQALLNSGSSSEPEVRWWYFCTAGEVEWMESIAAIYLVKMKTHTDFMLECIQPLLVGILIIACSNLLKYFRAKKQHCYISSFIHKPEVGVWYHCII